MAMMMGHVVSEGTARRAQLDGIPAAGKTGTTNAYRDAWFVGYTGNFVGGVWYGNDDYSSTNRMTGGSLPAKTWHDIMEAAHQGIEIKELVGVGSGQKLPKGSIAATSAPTTSTAFPSWESTPFFQSSGVISTATSGFSICAMLRIEPGSNAPASKTT